jgi:hypothetical protein
MESAKDLFASQSTTPISAFNDQFSGANHSSGPDILGAALTGQPIIHADLLNYVQPTQLDGCRPLPYQNTGL